LINLIRYEKKSIKIAIYTFTSQKIANALLNAIDRTIDVELIIDGKQLQNDYMKKVISWLADRQINIWVYPAQTKMKQSLMHHKFCIFENNINDKSLISTGSYNFQKTQVVAKKMKP